MNLFTILPPTNNTLDPDQRTRLLRSTRKLEALLGTTPHLIESDVPQSKGNGVYGSKFSASVSSLGSNESEKEYAHVRPMGISEDYQQVVSGWSSSSSPSSSRSASPSSLNKVLVSKDKVDLNKIKKAKGGPQPVSQPLLLRMRAMPIGSKPKVKNTVSGPSPISTASRPARHLPAPIRVAPPLVTPFERRKLKVDSVLGPLSPVNLSHFPAHSHSVSICYSDLNLPTSPTTSASNTPVPSSPFPLSGLTDREKRRKMAKLHRIMGENIPPELVFGNTNQAADEKSDKMRKRRSYSMSDVQTSTVLESLALIAEEQPRCCKETNGKEKEVRSVRSPPSNLPVSQAARPTPPRNASVITQTTATKTSSPVYRQLSLSVKQKSRKSRPRSLTLGPDSAHATVNKRVAQQKKGGEYPGVTGRGTVSLDEGRDRDTYNSGKKQYDEKAKAQRLGPSFSQVGSMASTTTTSSSSHLKVKPEVWRRKEKGWSGEWNVRDMQEVAKALRELKAR